MSEHYGLEEYELSETCVCRVCGEKDWYGKPGGWKWVDPRLCRDCAEKSNRIDEIRAEVEREKQAVTCLTDGNRRELPPGRKEGERKCC